MSKITVILADDHVLFRDGTRRIIEQAADIEVIGEACNGEEAIELVTKHRPNIAQGQRY